MDKGFGFDHATLEQLGCSEVKCYSFVLIADEWSPTGTTGLHTCKHGPKHKQVGECQRGGRPYKFAVSWGPDGRSIEFFEPK